MNTYLPIRFVEKDRAAQLALMRSYPLATLITQGKQGLFANHLPLMAEERDTGLVLVGHLARANPQWRQFAEANALAVFNGPQTYVTPSWYANPLNVPTWNYAVVHAAGPVTLVEDAKGIRRILDRSVAEFERDEPKPWKMELPEAFTADLMQAIVGFEMKVERLDAKFKLSQNRDEADRQGVLQGLASRKDEQSRLVRELMLGIK